MTATRRDFLKILAGLAGAAVGIRTVYGVAPLPAPRARVSAAPLEDPKAIEAALFKFKEYCELLRWPGRPVLIIDPKQPVYRVACEVAKKHKGFTVEAPHWLAHAPKKPHAPTRHRAAPRRGARRPRRARPARRD